MACNHPGKGEVVPATLGLLGEAAVADLNQIAACCRSNWVLRGLFRPRFFAELFWLACLCAGLQKRKTTCADSLAIRSKTI
jgi:hypothetical protein